MRRNTENTPDGRLRWQCRRSSLELDLLLNGFLDNPRGYRILQKARREAFQELLNCSDEQLLAWLLLRQSPQKKSLRDVVHAILRAAQA